MEWLQDTGPWYFLKTAIDILLVAFITYRVITLLNRTRAMQLLLGVGIILLVDVAARVLELSTVAWLITNVSQYLVFGLIVLLQPELRRLISDIGRTRIFQWINPPEQAPVEPIVEACKNMAAQRVGSIIVILREIKPQAIIDSAVKVDGRVTAELLQTIFHKDTPLHDGAVFIEGDRVVAASCYLPLSNSRLKKTHGARHRAGMGMSEESDGIVLVTSEETGRVTVMYHGELKSPVRPAELRPLLERLLSSPSEKLHGKSKGGEGESREGQDQGAKAESR